MMKRTICIILTLVLTMLCCFGCTSANDIQESDSEKVGKVPLHVETYLAGRNQPTHPSVVVFEEPWNGYRYWMAYSPYPNMNGEEENACIAVSNDLYDWSVPYGMVNPIADNEETGCHELKDPHILYREDLDRIEVWYLGRLSENLGGNNYDLLLFRKYSEDGVNWSDYEVMDSVKYLSPSVYWNGEKYQMWSIGYDMWGTTGQFAYQESVDGKIWTAPVSCEIDGIKDEIDIWHGSIFVVDGTYHFVYIEQKEKQNIYYCTSADGITFGQKQILIQNDGTWDYFYRPTLVMEQGKIACIYGVINEANEWYLSMSTGSDLAELKGITEDDKDRMHPMPEDFADTDRLEYKVERLKVAVKRFFRLKLLVVVMFEIFLMLVIGKLNRKIYVFAVLLANMALTGVHLYYRMAPSGWIEFAGATVAFLALNGIAFIGLTYVYLLKTYIKNRKSGV